MLSPIATAARANMVTSRGTVARPATPAIARCHAPGVLARSLLVLSVLFLIGCGSESVAQFPPAAEPPVSPPSSAPPAGRVVAVGREPEGIAVDARTGIVAVALRGPAQIALLNTNGSLLRRVPVAGAARHLALGDRGGPLLVPEESIGRLQAVSLRSGRVTASVPMGRGPHDAVTVGGSWFVGDEFSNLVSVVRRGLLAATFPVAVQPGGLAAAPASRVAVVAVRERVLELYSSITLRRVARAPAGVGPTHVACLGSPPGGYCFVADTAGDALLIFSLTPKLQLVRRVYLPGGPYGIALDACHRALWVTLPGLNQIVELSANGWSTGVERRWPTVRQPNSVAVDSVTGRVFIAGRQDGVIQILDPQ
jgi:DNA-binding beta-propeller fold protein YncE